jgi:hypothetical protein
MLLGAAIGAQFGTLATQYVKGLKIRLYFSVTMLLAGVSVIFKHIAGTYKAVYSSKLNEWVKTNPAFLEYTKTEGANVSSLKGQVAEWLMMNKAAAQTWIAQQSDAIVQARAMEKMWNAYAGYLMLGAAVGLSILIIIKMVQGIQLEKRLSVQAKAVAEE